MRKQNVDHHSNLVVNKTIGKDVGNNLAEYAGVNQDKSAEFNLINLKQRLKPKIFKILK